MSYVDDMDKWKADNYKSEKYKDAGPRLFDVILDKERCVHVSKCNDEVDESECEVYQSVNGPVKLPLRRLKKNLYCPESTNFDGDNFIGKAGHEIRAFQQLTTTQLNVQVQPVIEFVEIVSVKQSSGADLLNKL